MDDITQMGIDQLMGSGQSPLIVNVPQTTEDLQRTEEWHKARKGRFTGSKMDDLMKCNRSASKMSWNDVDKVFEFGEMAIKYIYSRYKERSTGIKPQSPDSWHMKWGRHAEPILIQQLLDDKVIQEHQQCGFELFQEIDYAGSSPDGKVWILDEKMAFELKACTSWDGHYDRMPEERLHEKSKDFWQVQAEMLSLGLNSLLYVVAQPMQTDKYDWQIVKASPIHQNAMLRRCEIANAAVEYCIKNGGSIRVALEVAVANYKLEPNTEDDNPELTES